jgi:hypothetical protein
LKLWGESKTWAQLPVPKVSGLKTDNVPSGGERVTFDDMSARMAVGGSPVSLCIAAQGHVVRVQEALKKKE